MNPYVRDADFTLLNCDVLDGLRSLPDESVNCCVTSPPYWGLRDYDHDAQLGLEVSPAAYVEALVAVFREVRRVLSPRGSLWLNLGDTYNSNPSWGRGRSTLDGRPQDAIPSKPSGGWLAHAKTDTLKTKDLAMIPARVAIALQDDGWWIRAENIWHKTNTTPESAKDRTTRTHEHVFHLTRAAHYDYDSDAVAEPAAWDRWGAQTWNKENIGRARLTKRLAKEDVPVRDTRILRSVWSLPTASFDGAHFAVMPDRIAEIAILATSPPAGTVLDPFMGSGTTALVARKLGRRSIGIELNETYCHLAAKRLSQLSLLAEGAA